MLLILSLILYAPIAMIIHELGHLVAARKCGVRASELGLGIGPKLFGFRLGTLRFSVRAFPVASFVLLDGTQLEERTIRQQLLVHLGGVILNSAVGLLFFGTMFGWFNFLLAAGNLLPLYKHDGWKCGVVVVRALLQRKSEPVERVFTYSGGFLSLVFVVAIIRMFV